MNDLPIQSIEFTEKKITYQMTVWMLLLSGLLTGGSLLALMGIWKGQIGHFWVQALVAVFGIACSIAVYWLKQRTRYAGLLLLVPWPVMLFLSGFHGYASGFIAWLNLMIVRWNAGHEYDFSLFSGEATTHDLWACTLLCVLLYSEIAGIIVGRRKVWICGLYTLTWMLVQLLSGSFSPVSCILLMTGFFGIYISDKKLQIYERGLIWLLGIAAVLGICMVFAADLESTTVAEMRSQVENGIKTLRYGQSRLPEGDVNKAERLKADQTGDTLMTVRSEQIKTLYLKSFSGGRYEDGCWKPLSNTDFGGAYAGMMKWLKEQNFDPLTQSALYYNLSSDTDTLEMNQVKVAIDKAFRRPVYVPSSLESISGQDIHENKDSGMYSSGLTGVHRYTLEEISDARPSELVVSKEWLDDPENDAQAAYAAAEAVYREFVYTHYLTVDEKTQKFMQALFWDDYDTENDGIYRAVCQIRSKLETLVSYTDVPEKAPDGQDPIRYFLTKSHSGNAVQYASAAVEALRVHGIPARYAEGYYIADSDVADSTNGNVSVTSKDAHAWVEVYFDGIGWLPIEVTPGYYFDTVSLSQMVNTSNVVRKTAAMEDDASKAQPIISGGGDESSELPAPLAVMRDMVLVAIGLVMLLLILLVLIFVLLEIMRICVIFAEKKKTDQTRGIDAAEKIMHEIFYLLGLRGIQAHLGWEAEKADQALAEHVSTIEAGEYTRVCSILEKAIYGGCTLEPYEMRTLHYFLRKIAVPDKNDNWKLKIKMRYAPLFFKFQHKQ